MRELANIPFDLIDGPWHTCGDGKLLCRATCAIFELRDRLKHKQQGFFWCVLRVHGDATMRRYHCGRNTKEGVSYNLLGVSMTYYNPNVGGGDDGGAWQLNASDANCEWAGRRGYGS